MSSSSLFSTSELGFLTLTYRYLCTNFLNNGFLLLYIDLISVSYLLSLVSSNLPHHNHPIPLLSTRLPPIPFTSSPSLALSNPSVLCPNSNNLPLLLKISI